MSKTGLRDTLHLMRLSPADQLVRREPCTRVDVDRDAGDDARVRDRRAVVVRLAVIAGLTWHSSNTRL